MKALLVLLLLLVAAATAMNNNTQVLGKIVAEPLCGTPLDEADVVSTDAVLWYRHGLARSDKDRDVWAKQMLQVVRELSSSARISNSQILDWVDVLKTLAGKPVIHRSDWHHIRGEMYLLLAHCFSVPEFDGTRGASGGRAHVYHYKDMARKVQAVSEYVQGILNDHYLSDSTMSKMNRCSAVRAVLAACKDFHTCESDMGYWKDMDRECRLQKL